MLLIKCQQLKCKKNMFKTAKNRIFAKANLEKLIFRQQQNRLLLTYIEIVRAVFEKDSSIYNNMYAQIDDHNSHTLCLYTHLSNKNNYYYFRKHSTPATMANAVPVRKTTSSTCAGNAGCDGSRTNCPGPWSTRTRTSTSTG